MFPLFFILIHFFQKMSRQRKKAVIGKDLLYFLDKADVSDDASVRQIGWDESNDERMILIFGILSVQIYLKMKILFLIIVMINQMT